MPHKAEGIVDCLYLALMDAAKTDLRGAYASLTASEKQQAIAALKKVLAEIDQPPPVREICCKEPVPVDHYAREVTSSGLPVVLRNVMRKRINCGTVNLNQVRMEVRGQDLLIQPR